MNKFLDDVRRDAMKKFKPAGEEDKKQLMDAVVLMLELHGVLCIKGGWGLEKYVEKMQKMNY